MRAFLWWWEPATGFVERGSQTLEVWMSAPRPTRLVRAAPYGMREFAVRDLVGHVLGFGESTA